ncbi:MAG: methyltransferase domain-containing protein [Verrucomicrobia bacterium]|nr:methyltransferase domain-containing protein [Verrucomicrobiota bacterium]
MAPPTPEKIPTTRRQACSACGHAGLEEVIDLPGLPLTGIFVLPHERAGYPSFDQGLMRCTECGHGQLRETVDPRYLYQETYTHRSSLSPISARGNDFFLSFLEEIAAARRFECIAEIGCNDLYLLKKLAGRGEHRVGFDPIWKDRAADSAGGIRVFGKYIEEIDPARDLPAPADLVLSVHTLEHVDHPLNSLRPIFEHARPGALFVLEVPSLDTLLSIGRFDQIFHQHLNYFSLASMRRMIRQLGGEFISHRFNYGYWLGTMLVAFRKPSPAGTGAGAGPAPPPIGREEILTRYGHYRQAIGSVATALEHLIRQGTPAVGFGAAQMVPTLAYHLQSDLGCLQAILDDNPDKAGRTYPSIATTIRLAADYPHLEDYAVLVTALDSARPILNRVTSLRARYLIVTHNPV